MRSIQTPVGVSEIRLPPDSASALAFHSGLTYPLAPTYGLSTRVPEFADPLPLEDEPVPEDEPLPVDDEPVPEDEPLFEVPEPDEELPVFEPSLQTPHDASQLPANHACPQKPQETASLQDSEARGVSVQAVCPELELPLLELPEPELLVPEPVPVLPELVPVLVPLLELPFVFPLLVELPFVPLFDPWSLAADLVPSEPPPSPQPITNMPSKGKQNVETVLILNIV